MKLPPLTVIEASAGTGKTFSLVTRLLRLIFSGTEPERIVALTFSRMAAGEIFNSFIERLSHAALDDDAAREESGRMGRELAKEDFAAMLRKVISRQHLSLIGTLDSFMMRVVRMIPLELGLEGELSVMSDYRSPVERMRLVGEMMMRESEDAKSIFRQAFSLAFGCAGAKGFLAGFSEFIEKWHLKYRDFRENGAAAGLSDAEKLSEIAAAWGDARRIWGDDVPGDLEVSLADIRALADALEGFRGKKGADTFIDAVGAFAGAVPKTLPKCLQEEPAALGALAKMRAWKIGAALKATRGIFLLMHAYESAYAAKVRARGLLTFDDMPRLLNSLPEGVKLPLEYRMDSQFDHWALDEFQDTSRGQWKALKNLIYEASHDDSGKSVFIVGDRKQSIYEWRGGDVGILGGEVERAKSDGNLLDSLDESRRYVSVISEAVTRVFREETVRGAIDMDDAAESARWKCREHKSHDGATAGFVEVIQAEKTGRTANISDFFAPIEDALNAVRPWERGISTAILVRQNSTGEAVLGYLKSKGLSKVVFEGDSAVADCPVLSVMTELVKLAEHAGDRFAYAHIRCSPVAEALYPDSLPPPEELSARLLDDFTRIGMVRKFREVREALKKVPGSWNAFAESRFEDFIKCAAEFEEMRDATMRLSDFIAFLSHRTRRDFAEPGMVRIMTMHQSKGLGFDWVIIPFYEPEKLAAERHLGPLEHKDPDWILDNPGTALAMSDGVLAKAERARRQKQIYSSLCLDYVAMTRAKRALTVILHPQNAKPPPSPERFSDLVRYADLKTCGDPSWYTGMSAGNESGGKNERPVPVRSERRSVRKSRPGESFYSGLGGDILFDADFGGAARRGAEAHERYERIEWLDPAAAKNGFERALVKPDAEVTLWREKPYELFVDGRWESGRFDRVVFSGKDGGRSAVIYDFKTNARRRNETPEDFAERMKTVYRAQMAAYKSALSHLVADIPPDRIKTVLLLESTGMAVEVPDPVIRKNISLETFFTHTCQ